MNSFLCFAERSFAPFSLLFVFFSLVATASKCQFTLVSWFSFVLRLKVHCSFGVWLVSDCYFFHSYAPFANDLDIIPFCFGALQRRCTSTMHVDLINVARKKHNKWRKEPQQQQEQRNWNEFATFTLNSSLSFVFHCPCYFSPNYFWKKASNHVDITAFFMSVTLRQIEKVDGHLSYVLNSLSFSLFI